MRDAVPQSQPSFRYLRRAVGAIGRFYRPSRRANARNRRLGLEALEPRVLLDVNILGTGGDDVITVVGTGADSFEVNVNDGPTFLLPVVQLKKLNSPGLVTCGFTIHTQTKRPYGSVRSF